MKRPGHGIFINASGYTPRLKTDVEIAAAEVRAPPSFVASIPAYTPGATCVTLLTSSGAGLPYAIPARVLPTPQLVHAESDGIALYTAAALEAGFEGDRGQAETLHLPRGPQMVGLAQIKRTSSAEFVIGRYSKGQDERERFGSLVG